MGKANIKKPNIKMGNNQKMKTYTVVGGVYGVGKSTFTGAVSGLYKKKLPIVNKDQSEAARLIEKDVSFIHEATLADSTVYDNIVRAKQKGYRVEVYYIAISSAEESVKRIKNRVEKGGHPIDDETIYTRFAHRFDELVKIIPISDSVILYDNENGFLPVAVYSGGSFVETGLSLPKWYAELKEKVNAGS